MTLWLDMRQIDFRGWRIVVEEKTVVNTAPEHELHTHLILILSRLVTLDDGGVPILDDILRLHARIWPPGTLTDWRAPARRCWHRWT